jgi:hypothetical protein
MWYPRWTRNACIPWSNSRKDKHSPPIGYHAIGSLSYRQLVLRCFAYHWLCAPLHIWRQSISLSARNPRLKNVSAMTRGRILRTGSRADYARDPYLRSTVLENLTLTSGSSYEFEAREDDLNRGSCPNSRFLKKSYLPHF